MAQLLAGGIVALGVLIIAAAIFLARREKDVQVLPVATLTSEQHATTAPTTTTEAKEVLSPKPPHIEPKVAVVTENALSVSGQNNSIRLLHEEEVLPAWWHEQIDSLTTQVQQIREHAKDVERQITILGEIATLATELETLQSKHAIVREGKISLFPMQVNRQPTDVSYLTDKRPAVRKYTIEAM